MPLRHPRITWFRAQMRQVEEASDFVESSVMGKLTDLTSRIERDEPNLSTQDRDWFHDQAADEYWMTQDVLPQLLRRSLFVSAYTLFEVELDLFSRDLARTHPETGTQPSRHDRGIVRSQRYIKDTLQLPFPDQTPTWQTIKLLNSLRNAIVHRNGEIASDDSDSRNLISKWDSLDLIFGDELEVTNQFVPEVARVVNQFWSELNKALP